MPFEEEELIDDAFKALEASTIAALVDQAAEAYIRGEVRARKILGLGLDFNLISSKAVLATKNYRDMLEAQGGSLVTKITEDGKAYRTFEPWLKTGIDADRARVGEIVADAVREGKPLREVEKELEGVFSMREHNAKLTAYQETKAQFNSGAMARFKEEEIRKAKWVHMDPQDNPRPEHQELDGQVFDLDDPIWAELDLPWCHCYADPLIPTVEGMDEEEEVFNITNKIKDRINNYNFTNADEKEQ